MRAMCASPFSDTFVGALRHPISTYPPYARENPAILGLRAQKLPGLVVVRHTQPTARNDATRENAKLTMTKTQNIPYGQVNSNVTTNVIITPFDMSGMVL